MKPGRPRETSQVCVYSDDNERERFGETRKAKEAAQQNKLFISLLNEIIKIHNCITVSNPFCHPVMTLCSISFLLFFPHHPRIHSTANVERGSFKWINKGERCVFIVHDFIYHLNTLGKESEDSFSPSSCMRITKL